MTATTITQPEALAGGASIAVRDLWKVYGPHPDRYLEKMRSAGTQESDHDHTAAVTGVSFDVEPGETFVVMGLSGSGKSTLVRCLTRLVEPTAGAVEVDGRDVRAMSRSQLCNARRQDWAMVFQHFGLLPHRRVLHNVAYGLEVSGLPRRQREERAQEVVDLVGLAGVEHKFPQELSGGMRQRVGLARALAVSPRLLLLDEPFSALDPLIRTDLQDELLRLAKVVQQTSIFITHDLAEALKVGDRIAIMRDGAFVQVGTPEEIVLQPADDYVRRFAVEAPRAKVVRAGTITQKTVVLTGLETAEEALGTMFNAGCDSAIVNPGGAAPYAVTQAQLLLARSENVPVEDVRVGECATVRADDKLATVMERLVATGNPVLVEDAGSGLLGVVDNSAAVRALSNPPTVGEEKSDDN